MVEERSLMTDAELDAALEEALAAGPSPDFVTRVRESLTSENPPRRRSFPFVAATVTLAAAAMVLVMLDRRPFPMQTPARSALKSDSGRSTTSPLPVTTARAPSAFQRQSAKSRAVRLIRQETHDEHNEVLIPVGEQLARRRQLARPPTAMVRLATPVDPMEVAEIAIPPLRVEPLASEVEEGGQQ